MSRKGSFISVLHGTARDDLAAGATAGVAIAEAAAAEAVPDDCVSHPGSLDVPENIPVLVSVRNICRRGG